MRVPFILVLTAALSWAVAAGPAAATDDPPQFEMESFWMVFLERGDDPQERTPEQLDQLQAQHIEHLGRMWSEGHALVSGPFEVPREDRVRGITLYRGDLERDQVIELAGADPMVKAGWLKLTVRRWWALKGIMAFTSMDDWEAGL
jgi:uncharacterized protein YciI